MDSDLQIVEFGPFRADLRRRVLEREGVQVALSGKAFEILAALIAQNGGVLDKDSLMKAVWPDTVVEENNLTVNVSWLRKALGDSANDPKYIVTIPGRGYRFIGEIKVQEGARPKRWPIWPLAAALVLVLIGFALFVSKRPVAGANRIAVLPFRVLGSNPTNEYLGVGLADAVITRLANINTLTVRPMSSVLKLSGKDPLAAGRDAGADIVLDGKVQQLENNVRVSIQILRVRDGSSIWAGNFDEGVTNLFALEDSISARVASSLAQTLNIDPKRTTRNAEAYQDYLRGRYYASRYTEEGFRKGLDYLQKAIATDPGYALAYSGLADCYYDASNMLLPPEEAMLKAKAAASKAAEIDPALAEAHISLGIVASKYDWDWATAEHEFQTALKLNPNSAAAHVWFALYRAQLADLDTAVNEVKRAQELDPLSTDASSYLATVLYWARKNGPALDQAQKVLDFDPNYFPAYINKAWILEAQGKPAVDVCEKAKSMADNPWTLAALGRALALAGKKEDAQKILEALVKQASQQFVSGYDIAVVHAALGQNDDAFAWLDKAYQQRAEWLGYLKIDPQLDSLRQDARFRDLLRRLFPDR